MNAAATTPDTAAFYFRSASYIMRIGRERATNLAELLEGLRVCPDDSVFQHTFQTLREHHFISAGLVNDFAQWAYGACNEAELAERLSSVDVRDFSAIAPLRERLVTTVAEHLKAYPAAATRAAFEPFYFCASDTVVIPVPHVARSLEEFGACLEAVSRASIHYHFITSRLRLGLGSNDFCLWIENQLRLPRLAARFNRIDIYTATLEEVRQQMLRLVRAETKGRA
jgi:hypothetical protein